jgi:hypothetical protein
VDTRLSCGKGRRSPEDGAMSQEIIVSSDASVPIKPLIESAIQAELRMLDLAAERTRKRLQDFESVYGMASKEFESRFERGNLSESLDFLEWAGELKTFQMLNDQREALLGVRLS